MWGHLIVVAQLTASEEEYTDDNRTITHASYRPLYTHTITYEKKRCMAGT